MSLCIRSIQWCTADDRSSNGPCSYYDRARCFSGLTERNSQLIVSCRPCSTDRAQSLQLSVKRHVQEAHECEAAELSHDLYFELIKAGLFAEALCAFVELCLNGHGRPVSSVDLQTRALVDSLGRLQYASSLLGIDLVEITAKVIGNSRVDACEHGDGEDVSHSIGCNANYRRLRLMFFQQYYANTIFWNIGETSIAAIAISMF